MSTISDEQSQKATGCAPLKRWRIEPDPEEDVNSEVLNVPRNLEEASLKRLLAEFVINLSEFRVFTKVRPSRSMSGTF